MEGNRGWMGIQVVIEQREDTAKYDVIFSGKWEKKLEVAASRVQWQ